MITREDLKTVQTNIDIDTTEWCHVVAPDGKNYILSATNLTESDLQGMDPYIAIMYMVAPQYMVESVVYPADDNWTIQGECNEECSKGVCTRRVAEDRTTGDINRSYQLLLNYLNS